tara:strand:- start:297 stop:593 length:297 start_codon:yes stop_codon:yes gene_type:complete
MKRLNSKRIIRSLLVFLALIILLLIFLFISHNFIVNPIVYWLASTEGVRIFISCILSWIGLNIVFNFFYKRYKRRKKLGSFNALNVPYPRRFRGRGRS